LVNNSASLPVVADVIGDPHPEVFFVVQNDVKSYVQSLRYNNVSNTFNLTTWSTLPTQVDYGSVAVAKVPTTNNWLLCYLNQQRVFCADAATGVQLFSYLTGYTIAPKNDSVRSSISVDRLFASQPNDLYVLGLAKIYKYNTTGASFYCDIQYLDALIVPHAIDINLDGDAEIFYNNCVFFPTNCSIWWCAPTVANFANGDFVTSAVANMDDDPYGEVVFSGGGQAVCCEHNGVVRWKANMTKRGGPPALADITGDG